MQKSDLKVGYVVKTRDGHLRMVMNTKCDDICLVRKGGYTFLDGLTDDLTDDGGDKEFDVMEVYGFAPPFDSLAVKISTECRDLLWKRSEPKKMTVAEVCKALGYDVEIVKDGDSK